jgi:D-alanyl-D-alanine carboxypeptidase
MTDPAAPRMPDVERRRSSRPRPTRRAGLLLVAVGGLAVLGVGFARAAGELAGPPADGIAGYSMAAVSSAPCAPVAAPAGASGACAIPGTSSGGSAPPIAASAPAGASSGPSPSGPPVSSQPPTELPQAVLAMRLQATLDRARQKLAIPGVSATIVFPDGTTWTGVSGLADVAARTKVAPDTAFAYASVSKTFTSALILQLIGEGRLGLTDSATRFLPPVWLKVDPRITVGMLLNHTSGLADFFLNPKIDRPLQSSPTVAWTVDRSLRYVGKRLSPPGAAWHYSNTNYLLLGLIAERITGKTLADAIRTRLLEPTGLEGTWYQAGEASRMPLAHGYRFVGTKRTAKPIDLDDGSGIAPFRSVVTAAGGAGSIAGTSSDLAHWARALYGGKVLGPAGTAMLLSGFTKTRNYLPGVVYGYGVQAFTIDGHPSLGHSGRLLGFRSAVRHFPIDGVTIAVLTNQSRADPGVIVRALLSVAAPRPTPVAPTPDAPATSPCLSCRTAR